MILDVETGKAMSVVVGPGVAPIQYTTEVTLDSIPSKEVDRVIGKQEEVIDIDLRGIAILEDGEGDLVGESMAPSLAD